MTSRNPAHRHPSTFERAIPLDGCYGIRRTRRRKSTRGGKERRYHFLVNPNQYDHCSSRQVQHEAIPALSKVSTTALSIASGDSVAVRVLAMSATSKPGQGPPTRRTVSLSTLRALFRSTADPILLPAITITRPSWPRPVGVGLTKTATRAFEARVPCSNSESISPDDFIVSNTRTPGEGR